MILVHSVLDNEQKVNSRHNFHTKIKYGRFPYVHKAGIMFSSHQVVQRSIFHLSHLQDLYQAENFQVGIYRWGS